MKWQRTVLLDICSCDAGYGVCARRRDWLNAASCQRRSCSSRCLLKRLGMGLLMPVEGRFARECLLAVGKRASIVASAGVRAAMAGQAAAVAEGLCADCADMRFLACVDSLVDGQGRALDELLVAAEEVACVGSVAGMDAFYNFKERLLVFVLCQVHTALKTYRDGLSRFCEQSTWRMWCKSVASQACV